MQSLKAESIKKYLSNIDFKRDQWSIHQIAQDMQKFLGEVPGIDVIYKKDVMIPEGTTIAKEFKKIEKIKIVFTDTDDKIKKIEIVI